MLLPSQGNEGASDFLASMALYAEMLRASARGDHAVADEHAAAAKRLWDGRPIVVEVAEPTDER
jgi:hypothetical protein